VIFPYKIADEVSKIANYFQTKNKFYENSTWCTFKYPNHEIQNKKLKSFSKIKKLDSFFDFHTKRRKLQNRGMQLLAVILGFGGWNFAGDIIMNHIIHFLLLQLDPKEKVNFSNTLINIGTGTIHSCINYMEWLIQLKPLAIGWQIFSAAERKQLQLYEPFDICSWLLKPKQKSSRYWFYEINGPSGFGRRNLALLLKNFSSNDLFWFYYT
jgi:hypothetical protein